METTNTTPESPKKSNKKAWIIGLIASAVMCGIYYKRDLVLPAEKINCDTAAIATPTASVVDTTKKDTTANATGPKSDTIK